RGSTCSPCCPMESAGHRLAFPLRPVPPPELRPISLLSRVLCENLASLLFLCLLAPVDKLLVEPDVFHAIAVVDAVDHRHEPLDIRLRAGPTARIEDDRPGTVLGQTPLDLPDELSALGLVSLGRLPVDQRVDLGTAIARIVAHRPAHEVLVEL